MLNMSSQLMWEEARRRGVTCQQIGQTQAIKMSKNGQSWFVAGSRTSFQSSIGFRAAQQKSLTKDFLLAANLPTARAIKAENEVQLTQAKKLTFPVVMKPLDGAHGAGVVVNIANFAQLTKTWRAQPGAVIVEEMLQGIEYRAVCVDFKLVAVAFRRPAFITGDGQKTVTQLVAEKNADPRRGEGHLQPLTKIILDREALNLLKKQNLTENSVLAAGREIALRQVANLSQGGEAINVTDEVAPENRVLFEAIAKAMDLNVCGIDMMCENLQTPILQQPHAGVIEVNGSPGLRMHHFPSIGEPIDVAGLIFDLIERELGKK